MRFNGLVLVAAAVALSACGGGETKSADTSAAAQPAASGTGTTGTTAAAPITGKWVEVKMIGDEKGYKFDPADVTIKAGDGVRWIMVTGAPHNVSFQNVAADARSQLSAKDRKSVV